MFKRWLRKKSKDESSLRSSIKSRTSDTIQLEEEKERLVSVSNKKENYGRIEEYDDLSFIVDYIGSDYISEAQSVPLLMETLKRIKKQHHKTIRVDLVLKSGVLKVIDNEKRALLITAPLYAIALAAQEQLRGFETAFALNVTRRRIHMCHVFQTGSRLEAAAIVRAIALSFRSVAKDLKEKHYESSSVERIRSDSERGRSDVDGPRHRSNTATEFDLIARRHNNKHIGLPTLPSEEDLEAIKGQNVENTRKITAMVHQRNQSLEQEDKNNDLQDKQVSPDDATEKLMEAPVDLCEKAIQAIQQHDLKLLQRCIDDGLSVDTSDVNLLSLLHHAVINHDSEIAEFLLEKGADPNKEGPKDQTPLHFAAAEGDRAITQILLANGANVRAKDSQFRTPLHLCASCLQSLEVSFVFVEHGARIEDNDIEGVRPVDLHHDLREMQNRLIQSNTEAFASAEIDRSRSNSNCSSTSGSNRSVPRSPGVSKRGYNKLGRSNSLRMRTSSSLQSIPDVSDGDSLLSPISFRKTDDDKSNVQAGKINEKQQLEKDTLNTFSSEPSKQSDAEQFSDPVNSGYTSMRRDSTTDSEFETHKDHTCFSDDGLCASESDDDNLKNMRDIIGQKTLHSVRLSIPGSFAKLPRKNAATTALDLLVTLSGNSECQSSILAHLCLPKASQQLVNLAHSVVSNTNNLQQISRLLHNLFTVSGPTGRKKCIDAGLLKTVIDLLDAAEPVQSTCLSILNDLLQTENERDYSGTMAGIPIEPLLTIIKTSDSYHGADINDTLNEKMKMNKISRSSDSGYPNSPALVERSHSLRKRQDSDTDISLRIASLPRSKSRSALKIDLGPSSSEAIGRGRSKSFSSSADVGIRRDSSPTVGRVGIGSRGSDSDSKDGCSGTSGSSGSSGHVNPRVRKFSRGSNGSVEGTTKSSKPSSVVARHVAMKMLAASSRSYKLQEELAKPQILKLLLDCLDDSDDEVILQSTATLANIAMNVGTHAQIIEENIEEELFKLLHHSNPRIQYQAARGLVYMGHLDVDGMYIYNFIPDEDSSSTAIFMEDDGKTFIRGTTVENLVLTLTKTKDIFLLWGGSNVTPSESSQKKSISRHQASKSRLRSMPTEYQIINFILSTYQTYIHPVIFMRLLLHRFREPSPYRQFRSLHEEEDSHMEHYAPLPVLHARLMRVWIAWLENYPDDFVNFPTLKNELSDLIAPMRCIDGPYSPCANRLDTLLSKTSEMSVNLNVYRFESESHHNILYDQCYKAIKDGKMPCSEDDYVYLAGLQLYIEDLCEYGQDFPQRLNTIESITSSRLKQSIGSSASSSKQLLKKIRSHYESFLGKQPTERNAKHNYVDCCQGMEGYGCIFFRVKQRIPGNRSRKKVYITRLFGINSKRIVLLDERSKVCVEKFNPKYLHKWEPFEDSLTVKMHFKTRKMEKSLEMQLDSRLGFKELSNHILTCRMELNFQGYQNIDTNPWSRLAEELGTWGNMALQLFTDKKKSETVEEPIAEEPRRGRSTTTTAFPMTGPSHSAAISSSMPKNYSQSAPEKQESGWSAQEVLSFLNLRSILRRGDAIMNMPTSPTNSESGTPPKDGELGDSFSESPPQQTSIMESFRRPSHVTNPVSQETMPIIDEGTTPAPNERSGDHSPTDFPKYGNTSKMLTCHCPPDADFPYLNLREFSASELLDHPKELARQITLIDHKMFCAITSKDVMLKISFGLIKRFQKPELHLTVEKIAQRFNQMSNWIVYSIVSERNIQRRAKLFINFIETAKQCLELRNYNAVTAIVVAALGSAPVRRLEGTKELIPPEYLSWMHKMENLMDSRGNHKKYRETLRTSPTPTVPYFGIYLKDLTFISDGNPDYLKGGVINLSKRRQVYVLLEEIHRFQKKRYNFQEVPEIKEYLLSKSFVNEEELHKMSKRNEPTIQSRLGSPTPPVSHYHYSDRRSSMPSMPSNLFRYNPTNTRLSGRKNTQRSGTSATSV